MVSVVRDGDYGWPVDVDPERSRAIERQVLAAVDTSGTAR
jgi:hypothetical protein